MATSPQTKEKKNSEIQMLSINLRLLGWKVDLILLEKLPFSSQQEATGPMFLMPLVTIN